MYSGSVKIINFRRLFILGLILACFTGVLLAQTFHYSRGWTNGKRRSPMISALGDGNGEADGFGVWQIQRLKRLLELSQCCGASLPRDVMERAVDNINRLKRNVGFHAASHTNDLPKAKK